ncbi:MAG: TldD/PmbA family protein [Clostridia bacterium]|nr:TldD/PmbA family protein [Clostridia bacterium]
MNEKIIPPAGDMTLETFCSRALAMAQESGVSPAEICYKASESFSVTVREGKLEDYKVNDRFSLTMRGRFAGRIGTASTQALDEESLTMLIDGVRESAQLIETEDQDELCPPEEAYSSVCNCSEALESVTAEEKIALAMEIDRRMCANDPRVRPDASVVSTARETFSLRNTLGMCLSHTSNLIFAYGSCLIKEGENAATGFKLLWGHSLEDVDAAKIADGCTQDAAGKLGAGRMKSGAVPVVIRSGAMADLLTTFSGVFSADNAQKGMSLLAGKEGCVIASPHVSIIDDPLMTFGIGSCPFDREGAASVTKHVVENGTLKTLLHNRRTAARAGVHTTGNAASGGQIAPSNLYISPGKKSLDTLLEEMGEGLLLTEVSGLHAGANPISGDFSLLARGWEVHGGRAVRAVEQFTVAGNFYRLMENVTAVADDLLFEGSPIGSPSVAVKSLSVAGE